MVSRPQPKRRSACRGFPSQLQGDFREEQAMLVSLETLGSGAEQGFVTSKQVFHSLDRRERGKYG